VKHKLPVNVGCLYNLNQPQSEYKHWLTFRVWRYAFAVYKAIRLHTCVLSWQRNPCSDCKSAQ